MTLLKPPLLPMEALLVQDIPGGKGAWQYEPKWDGFRCLIFRHGRDVYLQSKSEKPLARYFPEIVQAVQELKAQHVVLDGELVVPVGGQFDFDQLLQRIHPAASRIQKLAAAHPALFIAFDLLADGRGRSLVERPLEDAGPFWKTSCAIIFRRKACSIFRPSRLDWRRPKNGLDPLAAISMA